MSDDDLVTIFFLADDGVKAWLPSMLGSLRRWHPAAKLVWIPFSDNDQETRRWVARAGAVEYWNEELLEALERLGKELLPENITGARLFRKLAPFIEAKENFLFIDTDVVVRGPVLALTALLQSAGVDAVFTDEGIEDVFVDSAWLREQLAAGPISCFNTGLFAGRGGCFSLKEAQQVAAALPLPAKVIFAPTGEQPFINLLFHVLGLKALSIEAVRPDCANIIVPIGARRSELRAKTALHWAGRKPSLRLPMASVLARESVRLWPGRGLTLFLQEHALRSTVRWVRYPEYRRA